MLAGMFGRLSLLVTCIHILLVPSFTSALGTSCTAPLTAGTAAPQDSYWLETIKHQGISAFNPDPATYQVFRNVKDFGAAGDGVTDDTDAINAAMSTGDRCGGAHAVPRPSRLLLSISRLVHTWSRLQSIRTTTRK